LECFEADQAAGDRDEGFVDVGASFVAEAEPAVLVEPGEGALDDPALTAEAGAVSGALMGDHRCDLAGPQPRFGGVGVVAAVAEQRARTASWSAGLAADGRDCFDQGEQL
jgi:hypothetical protein